MDFVHSNYLCQNIHSSVLGGAQTHSVCLIFSCDISSRSPPVPTVVPLSALLQLCNFAGLLDRPAGRTSWMDQLDGPALSI